MAAKKKSQSVPEIIRHYLETGGNAVRPLFQRHRPTMGKSGKGAGPGDPLEFIRDACYAAHCYTVCVGFIIPVFSVHGLSLP